jgi:hypothetical protein
MIRLPVRVISEGVSSLTLAMLKVKALSKVCELASVTLTVILRFLVDSATDADVGDTFTYTLVNNSAAYFAIDGNTLKLAKTVDYETTKNLNITVRAEGVSSLTSVMLKVKVLSKVCELASVTLTVILRFLVVS